MKFGQKRLLGIWDLNASPISLGGMLIFVEELEMQRMTHRIPFAEMSLIGNPAQRRLLQTLLSAVRNLQGVGRCYWFGTLSEVSTFLRGRQGSYLTLPELGERGLGYHRYGSTLSAQEFYKENGFIPYLRCKREPTGWAVHFLRRWVGPSLPVVVHLKRNVNFSEDGDLDAWEDFLKATGRDFPKVRFILIGNEEMPTRLSQLANVLVAKELGSNLSRDLALIQLAFAFVGVASGPCNMALFSKTPYLIYKNPRQHPEEMAVELGVSESFPFATPFQRIRRVSVTAEELLTDFVDLYERLNPEGWENRKEAEVVEQR